jgi:hypothetical protein
MLSWVIINMAPDSEVLMSTYATFPTEMIKHIPTTRGRYAYPRFAEKLFGFSLWLRWRRASQGHLTGVDEREHYYSSA